MILALDLGTVTGFAYKENGKIISGTWDFSKVKHAGYKYVALHSEISYLLSTKTDLACVSFELVMRHAGTGAAHAYGGFMSQVQSACFLHDKNLPLVGRQVKTIKKHWTGNGNASKLQMIEEARRRGFSPKDDNEADALALLHLVLEEYQNGILLS